jgi:hypothetical protein
VTARAVGRLVGIAQGRSWDWRDSLSTSVQKWP